MVDFFVAMATSVLKQRNSICNCGREKFNIWQKSLGDMLCWNCWQFWFGCHGNQSSKWIGFVLSSLEDDLISNVSVKFYLFDSVANKRRILTMPDVGRPTDDRRWMSDTARSQKLIIGTLFLGELKCHKKWIYLTITQLFFWSKS